MIEDYLMTGLPINLGSMGIIYQPTIEEILIKGVTSKEILQPFLLHLGLVMDDEESESCKMLKNFDLFFIGHNGLLGHLVKSLSILFKTTDIVISKDKVLEDKKIIIDNKWIINRNNYDELNDVVLQMFCAERPKKDEEEKVNLPTEKHKRLWEQMQERKRKKALKEQMHMCDIINVVCHGGSFIPYEQVKKFTYYQLINSYKTITRIENYKEFTQFKVSPKFDIKNDIKHWITEIKVSKMPLS